MNGVERMGGAGSAGRVFHLTRKPNRPSEPDVRTPERTRGMDGALEIFREYTRRALSNAGFIDFQAGANERLRALFKRAFTQRNKIEVRLDAGAAAEVAAHRGAPANGNINRALRILAHVDPARVAALLR